MDFDRFIYLAPASQQCPQRKMGLNCFAVNLERFDEGIDRLVWLIVQQVIEPDKIVMKDKSQHIISLFV